MANDIGENQAKRKIAAGELVLCMGVSFRSECAI
jgi:hypothetical protein